MFFFWKKIFKAEGPTFPFYRGGSRGPGDERPMSCMGGGVGCRTRFLKPVLFLIPRTCGFPVFFHPCTFQSTETKSYYTHTYTYTYIYTICVYTHTCVWVCVCNFPKDHTLPVSFIFLLESSQRCYVLERGVCLRGKSDWSRGPRRAAVLPLSLFLVFEQTQ